MKKIHGFLKHFTKKQQIKIDAKRSFTQAFQKRDFNKMETLINTFPFLKSLRISNNSPLLENYTHYITNIESFPEGLNFPVIAVYAYDFQMLDFLLNLGINIRTKKGTGEVSIESNPLHVGIKIDFYSAANRILEHEGHVPFGKRNRLIDEKEQNKKTPWALAIEKDMETDKIRFIPLIG